MNAAGGILYVVATPIGNLADLSPRALETLRQVDYIAAEDTRHSRALLQHFGIAAHLMSLHEHNEAARIAKIINDLQAGKAIALITDAGTPLISDPGFELLRRIRELGLQATPIPGPCSLIAALSVAGLPTDRFVFEGFLPARAPARRARLQALAQEQRTLAFFEASHRVAECLEDLAAVFGEQRRAVLARELSKRFEEIHSDTLAGLQQWLHAETQRRRGEFVILLQGAPKPDPQALTAETTQLLRVLLEELPVKRAVAAAARITGQKKNALYDLALTLKTD